MTDAANGFGLIQDIDVRLTVELGRTQMRLREVLDLGEESVVMLDRLTDEPLDDESRACRPIRKSWAGGGGFKADDIDVVLDRKDQAVERLSVRAGSFECRRFREQVRLRSEADEDRGVIGLGEARKRPAD